MNYMKNEFALLLFGILSMQALIIDDGRWHYNQVKINPTTISVPLILLMGALSL